MKLLTLIIEGYQEIEVYGFLGTINRSKQFSKIDYWNPDEKEIVYGSNQIGSIQTITQNINVNDYDAIFIPGGEACINLRTNTKALNLIKEFVNQDKWIFAICDAPNALFDNQILENKVYSSYPIPNIKKISSPKRTSNYVSVDGKYISGKCPSASIDLALKVLEIVFSKEISEKVYCEVYAIE